MSTTHRRGSQCRPSISVLHPHIHRMHVAHAAVIICDTDTWWVGRWVLHVNRTSLRHLSWYTMHRKSRIVNIVELLHKAVDEHCEQRLSEIQKAKERHAYELKSKAGRPLCVTTRPCLCM